MISLLYFVFLIGIMIIGVLALIVAGIISKAVKELQNNLRNQMSIMYGDDYRE